MKKLLKLDSFWLRIAALITMTIDHIGVFLDFNVAIPLRIIGRIALPLFIFLTVEGAMKTSNRKKYFWRIFTCFAGVALVLGFCQIIGAIVPQLSKSFTEIAFEAGNIFFDLLLIIISVYILESDNKKIKPLIILPIAYSILSFTVIKLESCGCRGRYEWLLPSFRLQYGYYSIFLGLGFYFAKKFAPLFLKKYSEAYAEDEEMVQITSNLISVGALIFFTIVFMLVNIPFGTMYDLPLDSVQSYAVLASVFILMYNGKRGYNAKWFKVAYYLYYPVHAGIIFLVFLLVEVL